ATAEGDGVTFTPSAGAEIVCTFQNSVFANVDIDKAGPEQMEVGSSGSYTVTITNVGDADTSDPIVVVDTLPAGLSNVSVTADGNWTCNLDDVTEPATVAGDT